MAIGKKQETFRGKTIEDLKALPASAIDAINDINALGEAMGDTDKEGNSND